MSQEYELTPFDVALLKAHQEQLTAIAGSDAQRVSRWDFNAARRSAEKLREFERKAAAAEIREQLEAHNSTCVREEAHIANPLEYPLRQVTQQRNLLGLACGILALGMITVTVVNVMMWMRGGL